MECFYRHFWNGLCSSIWLHVLHTHCESEFFCYWIRCFSFLLFFILLFSFTQSAEKWTKNFFFQVQSRKKKIIVFVAIVFAHRVKCMEWKWSTLLCWVVCCLCFRSFNPIFVYLLISPSVHTCVCVCVYGFLLIQKVLRVNEIVFHRKNTWDTALARAETFTGYVR